MVVWFNQSLKKLNEKKQAEQAQKDEISELQDAIIEIAGMVETMAIPSVSEEKDGENNG